MYNATKWSVSTSTMASTLTSHVYLHSFDSLILLVDIDFVVPAGKEVSHS
jgi:hypothetical protein